LEMVQLEINLREHAARMKENIAAPFQSETEVILMTNANYNTRAGRRRAKKMIAIVAIAAAFLVGSTAFAAGVIGGWFSAPDTRYESAPDVQQISADIGYKAVVPESFSNGYSYAYGYTADNEMISSIDGSAENFRSATFVYEKEGDLLYFSQEKSEVLLKQMGDVIAEAGGIELYYYSYENKFVPADYEMTEADREAEEKGELIFSYGADKVGTMSVTSLAWVQNGTSYMLMQMDGMLSPDALVDMAKEVIIN